MTRSSFRPMASVGLVAAVLAYVGCSKDPDTADSPSTTKSAPLKPIDGPIPTKLEVTGETKAEPAKKKEEEKIPKIIADWSAKPPVAILLISGEQDGYPDPCGCTDGQLGGLGRRYHFCEMLEAKGWPVVKIDLGNLVHYRGAEWVAQERIKFSVIQKALAAMKYDAVALGIEDLRLGVTETLVALLNSKIGRAHV